MGLLELVVWPVCALSPPPFVFLTLLFFSRCQLRAKDIMGRDPVALHKWASLEDVLTVLRKHKKTYQKESDNYEIPIVKMKKMDSHQKQKKLIDDTVSEKYLINFSRYSLKRPRRSIQSWS